MLILRSVNFSKVAGDGCNFTKINTPPWVFFTFFELYKWYQTPQCITGITAQTMKFSCNPAQNGLFRACSRIGGEGKQAPLPKTCHTYHTMIKLGAVIPYLKKIQKIYESHNTPLEFCWHQHLFTGNQQILLYQEIQI